MKKIIYALIIPLLFVTRVNAEGLYSYPNAYQFINDYSNINVNYSSTIDSLISYYENNFKTDYSDYFIFLSVNGANYEYKWITLLPTTSNVFYHDFSTSLNDNLFKYDTNFASSGYVGCQAMILNNNSVISSPTISCYDGTPSTTSIFVPIISFSSMPYMTSRDFIYYNVNTEATLEIPSYTDSDFNFPSYTIGVNNVLPTYKSLVNNDYVVNPNSSFVNINLKNYDYVVLSLKNYNVSSLNTPIYTLGSLCITRVNNYGMTEISSTIPSYKTPSCSDYYTSSTPVNLYVDGNMLSSKPVWYIKSPSDERPNSISVNSDIFNISYIDSSNRDNPTVIIGGRDYPIIPYDNLTDTAIISTNEGYISGEVCSPFDNNCILNQNNIDSFDDIFSHPLQTLESVWTSIVAVFGVISAFLMLLPTPLQTFLYLSLMLGVILGLIKILI